MSATKSHSAGQLPAVELIEPEQLLPLIGQAGVLVFDVSNPATYQRLHIPGAVHIAPGQLVSGTAPATGMLPPWEHIQSLLNSAGYHPDKQIVIYDDEGGGWAGRLLWTLDLLGHQHSSYLNGGLHAWSHAQLPVQEKRVIPTPTRFKVRLVNPQVRMTAEEILTDLAQQTPTWTIWDARSTEEFLGIKQFARRAGHIPSAINLEWTVAMDHSRHHRIREDIANLLEEHGLGPDKNIVTHCQTHHRSGFTYMLARILGYGHIRGYDGSWSEWGNRPDTPIETLI